MKRTRRVSTLLLERYRLGEVSAKERKSVEAELAADGELRGRYELLNDSDRELRLRHPFESLDVQAALHDTAVPAANPHRFRSNERKRFFTPGRIWGFCAAGLLLCVLFPSLYYLRGQAIGAKSETGTSLVPGAGADRVKGTGTKTELSLYLKGNTVQSADPESSGAKLRDKTLLRAGNTVQLSYTTPPGAAYYGVIFSIDGRSTVTLHYPYRANLKPALVAGKRTFLSEAYTLDDAPLFETFFMVVSQSPLDTDEVLRTARELAMDPKTALGKSAAAFEGCEVETITVQK